MGGEAWTRVHGHSSHHPKAIEIYRGKPILYGCGGFLNDYEGIAGYEEFRDDLVVMYLPGWPRRAVSSQTSGCSFKSGSSV